MRQPDTARERLCILWRRHVGEWLCGGGEWPLDIGLRVPGERTAMQAWDAFEAWRAGWQTWHGSGEIVWAERRWPALGRQAVPEIWRLRDATEVAKALGELPRWQVAEQRLGEAIHRWPALEAHLRAQFAWLADIDEREWRRLCDMLAWLLAHPDSHLFVRQVPVVGLDSKWLEAHTSRLGEWMRLVTAAQVGNDFWQASGLRREADRLRLRLLDPGLRAVVGGLGDIHAPIDELARLPIAPRRVFIIENKQTGLAFEDVADSVVLMARGYAVDRLHELPWIARAEHVHYWGDIDTHGLAILGRLRSHLPQVASLMMDEATLLTHRDLWVDEPRPHAAEAIDHLDAAEQALYRDLRADRFGVRVRLEQERINWNFAWPRILEAAWQPAKKASET